MSRQDQRNRATMAAKAALRARLVDLMSLQDPLNPPDLLGQQDWNVVPEKPILRAVLALRLLPALPELRVQAEMAVLREQLERRVQQSQTNKSR